MTYTKILPVPGSPQGELCINAQGILLLAALCISEPDGACNKGRSRALIDATLDFARRRNYAEAELARRCLLNPAATRRQKQAYVDQIFAIVSPWDWFRAVLESQMGGWRHD
jgi:hypothetical protein